MSAGPRSPGLRGYLGLPRVLDLPSEPLIRQKIKQPLHDHLVDLFLLPQDPLCIVLWVKGLHLDHFAQLRRRC